MCQSRQERRALEGLGGDQQKIRQGIKETQNTKPVGNDEAENKLKVDQPTRAEKEMFFRGSRIREKGDLDEAKTDVP
ncbi:hypothetical protein BHYA_0039g00310 [Botrytis hyacinthi]|uniref:Uncharacterized protein n=1 Tax=Botrytis hyacinthi TaxID=278943 RepID=A0A4Z1GYZ8_9HELO|nr:hypothetical protein BHYA_0039g00310 [Botrytis hyacinthi]